MNHSVVVISTENTCFTTFITHLSRVDCWEFSRNMLFIANHLNTSTWMTREQRGHLQFWTCNSAKNTKIILQVRDNSKSFGDYKAIRVDMKIRKYLGMNFYVSWPFWPQWWKWNKHWKQTIKIRKYFGKNHDENEVGNNIKEVDNED